MSPTSSPVHPSCFDSEAKRFSSLISLGWPHARLRDRRIVCQSGPVSARWTPPERQPLAYQPSERGASAAAVCVLPNRSLARTFGFFSFLSAAFLSAPFLSLAPGAAAFCSAAGAAGGVAAGEGTGSRFASTGAGTLTEGGAACGSALAARGNTQKDTHG